MSSSEFSLAKYPKVYCFRSLSISRSCPEWFCNLYLITFSQNLSRLFHYSVINVRRCQTQLLKDNTFSIVCQQLFYFFLPSWALVSRGEDYNITSFYECQHCFFNIFTYIFLFHSKKEDIGALCMQHPNIFSYPNKILLSIHIIRLCW